MSNLADAIFEHARTTTRPGWPCGPATRVMTYGELRDRVASYAGRVAAAGIEPGDRVVLIAPTVPEFVVAYYGLHAAGAVLITMNVMATAPEIGYVLDDADASLVVAWHEASDRGDGGGRRARRCRSGPSVLVRSGPDEPRCRPGRPGRRRDRDHHLHVRHDRPPQGRRARGRRDLRARRHRASPARARPGDRPRRHGAAALPRLRTADRACTSRSPSVSRSRCCTRSTRAGWSR